MHRDPDSVVRNTIFTTTDSLGRQDIPGDRSPDLPLVQIQFQSGISHHIQSLHSLSLLRGRVVPRDGQGLAEDLTVRQRLLEFCHTSVGDFGIGGVIVGIGEVKHLQLRQPLKM